MSSKKSYFNRPKYCDVVGDDDDDCDKFIEVISFILENWSCTGNRNFCFYIPVFVWALLF